MTPRTYLPVLTLPLLIAGFALFAPVAHAKPKPTPGNAAQLKREADDAARKKAEEEHNRLAQGFYNDIHDANPNVTLDQVETMSSEDLRTLYSRAYCAKGMPLNEAKSKAAALKIWDN